MSRKVNDTVSFKKTSAGDLWQSPVNPMVQGQLLIFQNSLGFFSLQGSLSPWEKTKSLSVLSLTPDKKFLLKM